MRLLVVLLPCAVLCVNVVPKLDLVDESPGIIKAIVPKSLEPTVSPGVVKAVLEVNVGAITPKPEEKEDKKKRKKTQVLICTLEGNCKLREVLLELEEDKKTKPVIVTDFDVDPSKEKGEKKDDIPDVPVIVALKGAVQGDGYRLPVYYGLKLSPAFHQYPPPGSIIYEDPPPLQHEYLFEEYPGTRTPTPYGKFYPTSKPGISTLHRRAGWSGVQWSPSSSGWTGSNSPGWSNPSSPEWSKPSSPGWSKPSSPGWSKPSSPGWPKPSSPGWSKPSSPGWSKPSSPGWSSPGLVGSSRPGVYWPSDKPTPGIVSVHDKMDFDTAAVNGGVDVSAEVPTVGKGEVTVDGKLGAPLDKEDS